MNPINENEKQDIVHVALKLGRGLSTLTYLRPKNAENVIGRRVRIEVGKRIVTGVIISEDQIEKGDLTLKEIHFLADESPVITKEQMELSQFVSDYYEASLFDVLRLCLPKTHKSVESKTFLASPSFFKKLKADFKRSSKSPRITRSYLAKVGFSDTDVNDFIKSGNLTIPKSRTRTKSHFSLEQSNPVVNKTSEQQTAIRRVLEDKANAFLLQGVTGSGKTEVYLEVARQTLSQGQSVLIVVPEIALTPQLLTRVESALNVSACVIHSNVTPSERDQAFEKIRRGDIQVIIGARSALFCPATNLGLIVVDEEHDQGFKQEESPRYHARDVALWRAKNEGAKIILGSATPSLESLYNVEKGRLVHLHLTSRPGDSVLPTIQIIDLRERKAHEISRLKDRSASFGSQMCILSSPLRTAIKETLQKKEQVILFLNRRGWASFLLCEDCGHIVKCPDCSVSLTYHKNTNQLRCHQCSFATFFKPKCPDCADGSLKPLGLGTERVAKELQMSFPEAVVARFDRETIRHQNDLIRTLQKLHGREIDILVGTQMIAKGHDFPNVTLVGVVLADNGLGLPDFRASERNFQLLTQVSGRAGRRDKPGKVLIQAFNAQHPSVVYAQSHDVNTFNQLELLERKAFCYPPFSRAALIRIESIDEENAESLAQVVAENLKKKLSTLEPGSAQILGPAPCPNYKLRKYYRWQIFMKAKTVAIRKHLLAILKNISDFRKRGKQAKSRLIIDVDPVQLL